jgi:hypothetical protein
MIGLNLLRVTIAMVAATLTFISFLSIDASAQRRSAKGQHLSVCGNPKVPCKTVATFEPHDLPFRRPANAVIYDTELFYAIILKSVQSPDDECKIFIPEKERVAAQALFPDRKVFSSRCAQPGDLY